MSSLYHAYEAYERRVIRGEMETRAVKRAPAHVSHLSLRERLGDLLIRLGLKLKQRQAAGKPMAWSPLTGDKP